MKNCIAIAVASLLLGACGGGDGSAGTCSGSAAYCADNGSANNATQSLCGVDVGPNRLSGPVTDVHDGDTITLSAAGQVYKIRLDSIDAPELAQPFGSESRTALHNAVFGKAVRVAYAKTDQYGRIVGAVFTDTCQYVNLTQVATGMAWFYKAYQCEISASTRAQFAAAQASADSANLGLWSQPNPQAPWVFRNGFDPATPTCTSDAPVFTLAYQVDRRWQAASATPSNPGNDGFNFGEGARHFVGVDLHAQLARNLGG